MCTCDCTNRSYWNSALAKPSTALNWKVAWLVVTWLHWQMAAQMLPDSTHQHTHSHTHTAVCNVLTARHYFILFDLIWFDFPHISHAPHRIARLGFLLLAFVVKSFVHLPSPYSCFLLFWRLAWRWLNTNTSANTNRNKQMSPRWELRRKQKL